jgi:ubiquinone/menaquinone biosynthesis C-methylase UbiE
LGSRRAERVYDGFYAAVYDEIYLSDKYTNDLERMRPVLANLGAGDRILDSGCGTGTFCGLLSANHPLVEGLDLSSHMLREARRKYPGLTFTEGSILDADLYRAGSFRLILSQWDVLNYLESIQEYEVAFRNFHRWLQPAGLLCVELLVDQGRPGNGPNAFASTMVDSRDLRVDGAWDLRDSSHLVFRESIARLGSRRSNVHELLLLPLDAVCRLLEGAGFIVRGNLGDEVNPMLCCEAA